MVVLAWHDVWRFVKLDISYTALENEMKVLFI